jgi:hypothetical protein
MSQIMIRVPVAIAASILAALAGAASASPATAAAPEGRWPAPLDVAPPTINTNGGAVTYDRGNQSPIAIVGVNTTIALTGSCGEVDVNGTANTVRLQTVAIIKANGTGNHVTWQAGPGGAVPQISNTGVNNTVNGPAGA